jgi:hypothetical protein
MLCKHRSDCQGLRIDLHEIIAELQLIFKMKTISLNIHSETPAEILCNRIGKAVQLQAWSGPEGSSKLR